MMSSGAYIIFTRERNVYAVVISSKLELETGRFVMKPPSK